MITPKEIKEQALKWWTKVLCSSIDAVPFFPKSIDRIGRVGTKDILSKLSQYKESIELLKNNSKEIRKLGYALVTVERQFEKIGRQPVPERISIDSIEDYLSVTGKEKEYQVFQKNVSFVKRELPELIGWIRSNPLRLIDHPTWPDTVNVCQYFMETPVPDKYIRELPIDIHTKYIEENKALVSALLDYLIPGHINTEEKKFELRYHLKYSEPLIRVRFLDPALSPITNATDLSLTLSEFKNFESSCTHIFVAENVMNFLTLPFLPNTIALWSGGGFSVSYLRDIEWIKEKLFFYWGDLDAQGFQILNQFRTYFPNTVAVMMNDETLSTFKATEGRPAANQKLLRLAEEETRLYDYLRQTNMRLEQEKITQSFAEKAIMKIYREYKA
jgi:hypothetical protein